MFYIVIVAEKSKHFGACSGNTFWDFLHVRNFKGKSCLLCLYLPGGKEPFFLIKVKKVTIHVKLTIQNSNRYLFKYFF